MQATITEILTAYGLPIVALLLFAASLGIPTGVPVKLVVLLAGALCIGSPAMLVVAIIALAAAELAGATCLKWAADNGGNRLLDRFAKAGAPAMQERVQATHAKLGGRDIATVCLLRFVPGVRYWVALGAGLIGITTRDFLIGAVPASLFWVGGLLSVGYRFRNDLDQLEAQYQQILDWLPLVGLVAVVAVGMLWAVRRRARLRLPVAPDLPEPR